MKTDNASSSVLTLRFPSLQALDGSPPRPKPMKAFASFVGAICLLGVSVAAGQSAGYLRREEDVSLSNFERFPDGPMEANQESNEEGHHHRHKIHKVAIPVPVPIRVPVPVPVQGAVKTATVVDTIDNGGFIGGVSGGTVSGGAIGGTSAFGGAGGTVAGGAGGAVAGGAAAGGAATGGAGIGGGLPTPAPSNRARRPFPARTVTRDRFLMESRGAAHPMRWTGRH